VQEAESLVSALEELLTHPDLDPLTSVALILYGQSLSIYKGKAEAAQVVYVAYAR
jgi:hypothetical protein